MYEEEMNSDAPSGPTQTTQSTTIDTPKKPAFDPITECPNTKESLGFYTWNYLHTVGAYYPENPPKETQEDMTKFLQLFGKFYPCKTCASHYNMEIKRHPPKTANRKDLSLWLCLQHNNVNFSE
jgi:FAD-linked sulfhydryl oxidase